MPIPVRAGAPTLFIQRPIYERSALTRAAIDQRLGLADDEFRVEADLIAIGPIYDGEALGSLLEDLERQGLAYYDDFFELSGNWPDWLAVFAGASGNRDGRSKPSQPHS